MNYDTLHINGDDPTVINEDYLTWWSKENESDRKYKYGPNGRTNDSSGHVKLTKVFDELRTSTDQDDEIPEVFDWFERNFVGRKNDKADYPAYSINQDVWTYILPMYDKEQDKIVKSKEARRAKMLPYKASEMHPHAMCRRVLLKALKWPLMSFFERNKNYYWPAFRAEGENSYPPYICLDLDMFKEIKGARMSKQLTNMIRDIQDLLGDVSIYPITSASGNINGKHLYIFLDSDLTTMPLSELTEGMERILSPLILKYSKGKSQCFEKGSVEFFPSSSHAVILPFGLNGKLYTIDDGKVVAYPRKVEHCPYRSIKYLYKQDKGGKLKRLNRTRFDVLLKDSDVIEKKGSSVKAKEDEKHLIKGKAALISEIDQTKYSIKQLINLDIPNDQKYGGSTTLFLKFFLVPRLLRQTWIEDKDNHEHEPIRQLCEMWFKNKRGTLDSHRGIEEWINSDELDDIIIEKMSSFDPKKISTFSIQNDPFAPIVKYIWDCLAQDHVKNKYNDLDITRAAIFATYLLHYANPYAYGWEDYGQSCYGPKMKYHDSRGHIRYFRIITNSFIEKYWDALHNRKRSGFRKYVDLLVDIKLIEERFDPTEKGHFVSKYVLKLPFDLFEIKQEMRSLMFFWQTMNVYLDKKYFRDHFSKSVYTESFLNAGQRKSRKNQAKEDQDNGIPF